MAFFRCKNLGASSQYLYKWDFTKSLYDEVRNIPVMDYNTRMDPDGACIYGSNKYMVILAPLSSDCIYEFDIASMIKTYSSGHSRFIMKDDSNGFIYRSTGSWQVYDGSWYSDESGSPYVTDANIFNGKTIKMFYDNNDKLCVYADDLLVYRCSASNKLKTNHQFTVGATAQAYNTVTISGIRIYKNKEVQ